MVTHDPRSASQADRVLLLADGRLVSDMGAATPGDVVAAIDQVTCEEMIWS
jgi:putative ABC transport system ATP-binding protein